MAILTRYDTILFLVPLAVVLLWGMGPARRTRPVVAALGTTALFCVQSWLHQRFVAPFYQPLGGLVGGFLAAAALIVAALLAAAPHRRLAAAGGGDPAAGDGAAGRGGGAALPAGSCSAGSSAPVSPVRAGSAGSSATWSATRRSRGSRSSSPARESGNMLYLVDLLGAVGLLAALAGIAVLIVTRRRLWETAWLAASLAVLVVFTLNVFHDHFLMWVSRRFVPVVMPLASIGVAAAAALIASARRGRSPAPRLGRRRPRRGGHRAQRRRHRRDGERARVARPDRLVRAFRERPSAEDAELYCDQPGFAAPLRFIYGHRAYELPGRTPERTRDC